MGAILESAIIELDSQGIGGFRISRVLEASNASFSSIYHHFGNRDGLMREAHLTRFSRLIQNDLESLTLEAQNTSTTDEFFELMANRVVNLANSPAAQLRRRQLIESLGFALTDPELLDLIIPIQQRYLASIAELLEQVAERGLIRADINFKSYVAWFDGMLLGHVLLEIDRGVGPHSKSWDRCAILAILQPLTKNGESLTWSASLEATLHHGWGHASPLEWSESPEIPEHPTAKTLIANTMKILDDRGERAIRLPLILEGTGTSVSSIYHFFGDREGLVISANAERFMRVSPSVVLDYDTAISHAKTSEDFFAFLRLNLLTHVLNDDIVKWRWNRLKVLSSAIRRPALLAAVEKSQARIIEQFAAITREAQSRGYLDGTIEPKSATLWFQGLQLGRVLTEIQPELDLHNEWLDLTVEGLDAALRIR